MVQQSITTWSKLSRTHWRRTNDSASTRITLGELQLRQGCDHGGYPGCSHPRTTPSKPFISWGLPMSWFTFEAWLVHVGSEPSYIISRGYGWTSLNRCPSFFLPRKCGQKSMYGSKKMALQHEWCCWYVDMAGNETFCTKHMSNAADRKRKSTITFLHVETGNVACKHTQESNNKLPQHRKICSAMDTASWLSSLERLSSTVFEIGVFHRLIYSSTMGEQWCSEVFSSATLPNKRCFEC